MAATATPKVIGHRGAMGLAPENTVASMQKALEYGVQEIEIDARVTRDGIVVIAHNETITDQAGQQLIIQEHSYTELRQHKADLATLEDIIRCIDRAVPVIIEIKPKVAPEPVITIVKQFLDAGWQAGDFLFASFDFKVLLAVQRALPAITLVVNEHWSGVRATYRAGRLKTKRLAMNRRILWPGFISYLRLRGYELYPYTLNDPKQSKRMQKYGLAGFYTDYPDYFLTPKAL